MRSSSVRLVLADLVTPGQLSGAELAHRLVSRYPGLPVIVTAG